jgi:hypothetical protein
MFVTPLKQKAKCDYIKCKHEIELLHQFIDKLDGDLPPETLREALKWNNSIEAAKVQRKTFWGSVFIHPEYEKLPPFEV